MSYVKVKSVFCLYTVSRSVPVASVKNEYYYNPPHLAPHSVNDCDTVKYVYACISKTIIAISDNSCAAQELPTCSFIKNVTGNLLLKNLISRTNFSKNFRKFYFTSENFVPKPNMSNIA